MLKMRTLPNLLPLATCRQCPRGELSHGQTACELDSWRGVVKGRRIVFGFFWGQVLFFWGWRRRRNPAIATGSKPVLGALRWWVWICRRPSKNWAKRQSQSPREECCFTSRLETIACSFPDARRHWAPRNHQGFHDRWCLSSLSA